MAEIKNKSSFFPLLTIQRQYEMKFNKKNSTILVAALLKPILRICALIFVYIKR